MYWYMPWVWTMSFWESLMRGGEMGTTPLEDADLDAAAAIHSEAFDRAWTGDELSSLLRQNGAFGFVARPMGRPDVPPIGFVLARNTDGEAEILTIAVTKNARRHGVGRKLMDRVLQHLHSERAESLFLEVDEENAAARRLYARLHFEEVGRRPAYYKDAKGRRTSALTLKRSFARAARAR